MGNAPGFSFRVLVVALFLVVGGLGNALAQGSQPREQVSEDENGSSVTDSLVAHLSSEKLQRVADAYEAVEDLRAEYREEWGSLDTADLPPEVEKEFLRRVMDVMDAHELAWEEYRDVVNAVQNSSRLQRQFLPMIGEEVVVEADRDVQSVARGPASGNLRQIESGEIEALPVNSATDAIGLLPGIEPGMSMRGGGADEVSFNVDGMSMRMGRDGTPFTNISLTQIEEIHVQTGGFNAEYGNVRSGLVNVRTKGEIEAPALVNVSRSQLRAIARAYVAIQDLRREYGLIGSDLAELDLESSVQNEIESKMAQAIAAEEISISKYIEVIEASETNGNLRTRLFALIDQAREGTL